jgi:hypothetical protein
LTLLEQTIQFSLITLPSAPFTVVHANAAFYAQASLTSATVVGLPYHQVMDDSFWTSKLGHQEQGTLPPPTPLHQHRCSWSTQLQDRNVKVNSNTNKDDALRVSIMAVGDDAQRIKYLAFDLLPPPSPPHARAVVLPVKNEKEKHNAQQCQRSETIVTTRAKSSSSSSSSSSSCDSESKSKNSNSTFDLCKTVA